MTKDTPLSREEILRMMQYIGGNMDKGKNGERKIWVMVDVESDGPIPGDYSMLSFGAVAFNGYSFHSGIIQPISDKFIPEALEVNKISRSEALATGNPPDGTMRNFSDWLGNLGGKPMLISDNNGFDAMFIAWYFHHFLGENPFGHSSTNLGSLYKGMVKNVRKNFKHLRQTRHTHDPLDDARGNMEALQYMITQMGLAGVE